MLFKIIFICILIQTILISKEIPKCSNINFIKEYNVVGQNPPVNMLLKSLSNEFVLKEFSKKNKKFSKIQNIESLLVKKVNLVIFWNSKNTYAKISKKLDSVGINNCYLNLKSIKDYPKAYLVMGKIINKEKRAEKLSNFIKETLIEISRIRELIPENKKLKVYYAKGRDGLDTFSKKSLHYEAIELAGGINPVQNRAYKKSSIKINKEHLFIMDSDVIIAENKEFYNKLIKNNEYKSLKAVINKKVFLIPKDPINFLDNPPSFFKILGILWVGDKIYKKYYKNLYSNKNKEFRKLFLK